MDDERFDPVRGPVNTFARATRKLIADGDAEKFRWVVRVLAVLVCLLVAVSILR